MKKTIIFLLLAVLVVFAVAGCGNKVEKKANTTEKAQTSQKEDFTSKSESKFKVDENGSITYLKEKHPEVKAVNDMLIKFYKTVSLNYKTAKGGEEYDFYTAETVAGLEKKNDKQLTKNFFVNNQIIMISNGVDIESLSFNKDFTTANVSVYNKMTFESATPEFMKNNNIELNKPFKQSVILQLKKIDNKWKVDGFQSDQKFIPAN